MQRLTGRQTVEFGGNGAGGVGFEVNVPASDGGDLLKQRDELAGLDVRADTVAVGLPIQGVSGPGRKGREHRHDEPKGGHDYSGAARAAKNAAAPGAFKRKLPSNAPFERAA